MWKCRPSAWVWPGILAVGLLLLISMFLKSGSIENDLTKRALGKLSADHPWASVELDGRDLSISGVAPSLEAKQEALKFADGVFRDRDAGTWGVRVVDGSAIDELAVQSPFVTSGKFDGSTMTLSGYVPTEEATGTVEKATVAAMPGVTVVNELQAAGGAPDGLNDQIGFAVDQIKGLDSGEFKITDSSLDISGRAKDQASLNALNSTLGGNLPTGLKIGTVALSAPAPAPEPEPAPEVVAAPEPAPVPVFSPYIFGAQKSASGIVLEGSVPSEAVSASLAKQANDATSGTVTNNLTVSEDAPANFADMTSFGLSQFKSLDTAELSTFGDTMSLTGSASSPAAQSAVIAALEAAPNVGNSNIGVTPVSPFTYGATVGSDASQVTLTGNVPSATSKGALVSSAKGAGFETVVDQTEINAGAPASFVNAASFANKMVSNFSEGSVQIADQDIKINGVAKDAATYTAAHASADRIAAGYKLVEKNISLPTASPYRFSAVKNAGDVSFNGSVPSDAVKIGLAGAGGSQGWNVTDATTLANGAPAGFVGATQYGNDMLAHFSDGSVRIQDTDIFIDGTAATSEGYKIATADAKTPPEGFTVVSAEIDRAPVSPFKLNAWKKDGVSVSGLSPSREASIVMTAGANRQFGSDLNSVDLTIEAGAPAGYSSAVVKGFEGLTQLETGSLAISDTTATLYGVVPVSGSLNDIKDGFEKGLPEGFTGKAVLSQVPPPPAPVEPEPVAVAPAACSAGILEKIAKNKIFFQSAKAGILSDSFGLLDDVAAQIINCPDARFEVAGHTDSDGSEGFNQRLSEARATSVVNYLVNAGVSADRLNAVGYGETNPVVVNNSRENKAKNRRIEFSLIKAN